jgi:DinB superfamily
MNVVRRLDSTHDKLLRTIKPLSTEIYTSRPSEDEWSVAEIVHHLCLVERRVFKELGKALAQTPRQVGFLRRFVPVSIVGLRLIRVKAPEGVTPSNPPEKDETISAFNDIRGQVKKLYEEQGKDRLNQIVFKHPFLGELSGMAAVNFIAYHERRHYKQINEVLRKLNAN